MTFLHGLYWPDDVGLRYRHALKHVRSLEWAIAFCAQKRTAVQAGGNIGLWPRRLAEVFQRVVTFEPDDISRECLLRNVPTNVQVRHEALGASVGTCSVTHSSLGSHYVEAGTTVPMVVLDTLALTDVDFLQFDVEGYEWHALTGAEATIQRDRPLIQVELRGFTAKYGKTDADVRSLLASWGYREVSQQPGNDVVFARAA